ncbi:DNA recombination protein RmuC [Kangiella marina]|uniref:DNA recombination protein RmuC n=1 Tax=Kangiella marina TaxID=1079178 RepID=A0ABP8IA40_9GAMM
MDFTAFISENMPLVIILGVLLLIVLLLVIMVSKQSKTIQSIAESQYGATDGVKALEQKQTMAFEYAKADLHRMAEQSQRSSENFIEKLQGNQIKLGESFQAFQNQLQKDLTGFKDNLQKDIFKLKEQIETNQKESQAQLHEQFRRGIKDVREELTISLKTQGENIEKNMTGLTKATDERLKEISGQVEKRLADGFEKTTKTFQDVLKRLALIDDAQKKITELSSNVVSLQEILSDKRSRGAFGEVQLESLVSNVMPTTHYKFQHTFNNGKIADCALFLPEPTGVIGVDAKFPLENYQKMVDVELSKPERDASHRAFVQDIKKHVKDIASKYIIDGETATGAVMFIPAEAVFAEIHAHHPELVEFAQQSKVWMVSPTTMMALLTTASAVLKDEATRKQVHIIQEHLGKLSIEFGRFKDRWGKLNTHIDRLTKSAKDIDTTADKITRRFDQIEQVELQDDDDDDDPIGIGHQS